MKIIHSSGRRYNVARLSIFLVSVALIAGIAGCVYPPPFPTCDLTITSTTGGSVTTPGEGTFTYPLGETVKLVAMADEGYRFVEWTGDVSTIADVEAATTTIFMEYDYSLTASFAIPIEIWDWCDLDAVRDNPGGFYLLMNDLDSTTANYTELASSTANGGKGWQPITALNHTLTGTFDGQGYEIHDLHINRPDEDLVGLFGCVDPGGVIRDIGVVSASVTGNRGVAGLVGENMGIVSHCHSTGNVTGVDDVGGLVGKNFATVVSSYSRSTVTSTGGGVGGLVGSNEGSVTTSYSTGSVTGIVSVGGLVGAGWYGGLTTSYSTGDVNGEDYVGGLVGGNIEGTVNNSFWDTETSDQATSDGGTGKTTAQMKSIITFSGAGWNIIAVALNETNQAYVWNIVNNVTYPFLSWQS